MERHKTKEMLSKHYLIFVGYEDLIKKGDDYTVLFVLFIIIIQQWIGY